MRLQLFEYRRVTYKKRHKYEVVSLRGCIHRVKARGAEALRLFICWRQINNQHSRRCSSANYTQKHSKVGCQAGLRSAGLQAAAQSIPAKGVSI